MKSNSERIGNIYKKYEKKQSIKVKVLKLSISVCLIIVLAGGITLGLVLNNPPPVVYAQTLDYTQLFSLPVYNNSATLSVELKNCLQNNEESTKYMLLIRIDNLETAYPQVFADTRAYEGYTYAEYEQRISRYDAQLNSADWGINKWDNPEYLALLSARQVAVVNINAFSALMQNESLEKEYAWLISIGFEDVTPYGSTGSYPSKFVCVKGTVSAIEQLKNGKCGYCCLLNVSTKLQNNTKIQNYYGNYTGEKVLYSDIATSWRPDYSAYRLEITRDSLVLKTVNKDNSVDTVWKLDKATYNRFEMTAENNFGGLLYGQELIYVIMQHTSETTAINGLPTKKDIEELYNIVTYGACYEAIGVDTGDFSNNSANNTEKNNYRIFLYDGKIYIFAGCNLISLIKEG